jgi:hypothetical protein
LDFFQEWACRGVVVGCWSFEAVGTIISVMRNFEELVYGTFCIIFHMVTINFA